VSITGGLDAGYALTNNKGASFQQVKSNNTYTSNVTFLGTEDLGGGLSANFRWEIDIDPTLTAANTAGTPASPDNANAANYMGNGYSFVGLKSATAGAVEFGTLNTVTLDANGAGQPFGTAIGSGYKTVAIGATRYQKAVSYETPALFGGLTAKYLFVPKDAVQNDGATSSLPISGSMATNGRDQINELGLKYVSGPLTVMYANLQSKSYYSAGSATACSVATAAAATSASTATDGGVGNQCADGNSYKVNTLAGNYVVGDWTGYAWYQTQKADAQTTANGTTAAAATTSLNQLSTVDRTAKGIAAKFQATPVLTLQAGVRQITRNAGESYNTTIGQTSMVAGGIGKSTKVTALGADYALSKRTAVYFRYESITDDALLYNTRALAGSGYTGADQGNGKVTNTAVGFRHLF
jgi:predicted porin